MMDRKKQKIIAAVIAAAVVLGGTYVLFRRGDASLSFGSFRFGGEEPLIRPEQALFPLNGAAPAENTETYTNEWYGFAFRHPKDFSATELEEDIGVTVLLQKLGAREGFQLFVSEFDEAGPITPARIRQDLPNLEIENPVEVLIGEKKDIPALIFLSNHESLGRVREVWFVGSGLLFQLTAYADMDNLIGPILDTFRFE